MSVPMVLLLVPLIVVFVVGGHWLAREMCKVPEEQALAGLFGGPPREAVLAQRTASLIESAEAVLRIEGFCAALRARAFSGTPLSVSRLKGQWSMWSFADGTSFIVHHGRRPPRRLRRLIVAGVEPVADGVAVAAYGPVNGPDARWTVLDAREAQSRNENKKTWVA